MFDGCEACVVEDCGEFWANAREPMIGKRSEEESFFSGFDLDEGSRFAEF